MKKFKLTSSANGKVFRSGLYSTAILAAAIVLAVLVNLLAGAIPSKYTEFDLSAAKMYTLGDSSRQLMQSLDQDVTVYYLCETGSEDAIVSSCWIIMPMRAAVSTGNRKTLPSIRPLRPSTVQRMYPPAA